MSAPRAARRTPAFGAAAAPSLEAVGGQAAYPSAISRDVPSMAMTRTLSAVAIATGAVVLMGWALQLPALETLYITHVTVKANTAFGIGLAGLALWLLTTVPRRPLMRYLVAGVATTVVLLGAATVAEYLFGYDLHIDRLLASAHTEAALTATPGRMALATAVELILIGAALLFEDDIVPSLRRASGPLALSNAAIALTALLAYAYGAIPLAGLGQGVQMAVPTATAFAALSVGVLFLQPDRGLVGIGRSMRAGGTVARRLLPLTFVVPACLGAVRAVAGWAGGWSPPTVTATMAVLTMLAFGTMITWTARVLDRADLEREEAEAERMRMLIREQAALKARTVAEQARERLAAERRFLRTIIDANPNLIFVKDRAGRFVVANKAVAEMYGVPTEQIAGMADLEVSPDPIAAARARAIDEQVLTSLEARPADEETMTDVSGVVRVFQTARRPIVHRAGQAPQLLGVSTDVTERKRLEGQLMQSQKMEAIGRLAGGIAHDFNNLLTVITTYAALALETLGEEHLAAEDVRELQRAAGRAVALTRQLLAFSRRQVIEPRLLDLNEVSRGLEPMLRRLIGEDVELAFVHGADLCFARADPGQIEQIIVNLAVNARDAMPDGGQLTIETMNVALHGADKQSLGIADGRYVMLAVTDTGTGMGPDTIARIFEPFFTTKAADKGTGLGLSTVYGIVKQCQGEIRVYSEVHHGTTFKVYLPAVDAEGAVVNRTRATVDRDALRGTETVLAVEDDAAVRHVACRVLREAGYTVLEATGARDALAICQQHVGPIHVALVDLVMPGMGGRALAEQIEASRKDIRILFMSGYTEDTVIRHRVLESPAAFIEKPFAPETLLAKVRTVANASNGRRAS